VCSPARLPAWENSTTTRPRGRRQLCNIAAARSDLEQVIRIKAGHKAAVKELEAVAALEAAMGMLERLDSQGPEAARRAIAMVLEAAPDCTRAQVAEAQLEFAAKNYEQVRTAGCLLC
jgi:lipopolysaccharide biosynthesis regulator YciM